VTVHAGIDEAGYGPTLGPLVVASSAFRLADGARPTGLHRLIALGDHPEGLPIGDSKKLYRGGAGHDCLETSVLGHAVLGRGHLPRQVQALLAGMLDCPDEEVAEQPWYGSGLLALPLPRHAQAERILERAEHQRALLARRGIGFVDFAVAPVLEPRFNRLTLERGSKAWPLFLAAARLIEELMARHPQEELVITVDRHGGRAYYQQMLAERFPFVPIAVLRESSRHSAYRLDYPERPPVSVAFVVEADGRFAPVALASLVAKTVRELFMQSFNLWFGVALPGVRPTAGYHGDAHRFLRDVAPLLDVSVPRARLVRVR